MSSPDQPKHVTRFDAIDSLMITQRRNRKHQTDVLESQNQAAYEMQEIGNWVSKFLHERKNNQPWLRKFLPEHPLKADEAAGKFLEGIHQHLLKLSPETALQFLIQLEDNIARNNEPFNHISDLERTTLDTIRTVYEQKIALSNEHKLPTRYRLSPHSKLIANKAFQSTKKSLAKAHDGHPSGKAILEQFQHALHAVDEAITASYQLKRERIIQQATPEQFRQVAQKLQDFLLGLDVNALALTDISLVDDDTNPIGNAWMADNERVDIDLTRILKRARNRLRSALTSSNKNTQYTSLASAEAEIASVLETINLRLTKLLQQYSEKFYNETQYVIEGIRQDGSEEGWKKFDQFLQSLQKKITLIQANIDEIETYTTSLMNIGVPAPELSEAASAIHSAAIQHELLESMAGRTRAFALLEKLKKTHPKFVAGMKQVIKEIVADGKMTFQHVKRIADLSAGEAVLSAAATGVLIYFVTKLFQPDQLQTPQTEHSFVHDDASIHTGEDSPNTDNLGNLNISRISKASFFSLDDQTQEKPQTTSEQRTHYRNQLRRIFPHLGKDDQRALSPNTAAIDSIGTNEIRALMKVLEETITNAQTQKTPGSAELLPQYRGMLAALNHYLNQQSPEIQTQQQSAYLKKMNQEEEQVIEEASKELRELFASLKTNNTYYDWINFFSSSNEKQWQVLKKLSTAQWKYILRHELSGFARGPVGSKWEAMDKDTKGEISLIAFYAYEMCVGVKKFTNIKQLSNVELQELMFLNSIHSHFALAPGRGYGVTGDILIGGERIADEIFSTGNHMLRVVQKLPESKAKQLLDETRRKLGELQQKAIKERRGIEFVMEGVPSILKETLGEKAANYILEQMRQKRGSFMTKGSPYFNKRAMQEQLNSLREAGLPIGNIDPFDVEMYTFIEQKYRDYPSDRKGQESYDKMIYDFIKDRILTEKAEALRTKKTIVNQEEIDGLQVSDEEIRQRYQTVLEHSVRYARAFVAIEKEIVNRGGTINDGFLFFESTYLGKGYTASIRINISAQEMLRHLRREIENTQGLKVGPERKELPVYKKQ